MTARVIALDTLARELPKAFAEADAQGWSAFAVPTDAGEVHVRTRLGADGRLDFAATDPAGQPLGLRFDGEGRCGAFEVILNEYRRLRPQAPAPAGSCKFRCQDADDATGLPQRRPWLLLGDTGYACLRQGFPTDRSPSCLFVPFAQGAFEHRPNRLLEIDLALLATMARRNPQFLVFFNFKSEAAASIPEHLHGHGVLSPEPLPIERARLAPDPADGSGRTLTDYPAVTLGFDTDRQFELLWRGIRRLGEADQAFNLLVRGTTAYVSGRTRKFAPSLPGLGLGALEIAGRFIVEHPDAGRAITPGTLSDALREATLPHAALAEFFQR